MIFAPAEQPEPQRQNSVRGVGGRRMLGCVISLLVIGFGDPGRPSLSLRSIRSPKKWPSVYGRAKAWTASRTLWTLSGRLLRQVLRLAAERCGALHGRRRCCRDHDHHCGFYGRCIAKKNITAAVGPAGWAAIVTCIGGGAGGRG